MSNSLTQLPNIGKSLELKLNKCGIYSPEELRELGSKRTFLMISSLDNSGACINMLYALEGAIQDLRWHYLDDEVKKDLLNFFREQS